MRPRAWSVKEKSKIGYARMFRNFAETNATEALGLVSFKLICCLLLLGVLPSIAAWKTPISYRVWYRELFSKAVILTGCAAVIGGVAMLNYQGLSSLFRNHHDRHDSLKLSGSKLR
jgi:lipid A ethanolaminephosphotransferase